MADRANCTTIYEELKNEILAGQYPPSFALTEMQLAGRYGVCRNTVKKSLLMLESDGLVTIERNKGAKVKVCSRDEVLEFLEVREELEALVCRNAARNITDEQLVQLKLLLDEMRSHKEAKRLLEYSACNRKFHSIIYSACTNRTAVDMTVHLKDQMKKYNNKTILAPGRDESSLKEHLAIYESMVQHDPSAAEKAIRIHMKNVADTFSTYYELLFM
ncbi:MAG: GntR family transcriptional regulator [Bullifex sp.]